MESVTNINVPIAEPLRNEEGKSSPSQQSGSVAMFQCTMCRRPFTRLDHLARHAKTHTKERPYRCTQCNKAFARIDLLKRHACRHLSESARQNAYPILRVTQACKACASAKLKCDEITPCRRCKGKSIVCERDQSNSLSKSASQKARALTQSSVPLEAPPAQQLPVIDANTTGFSGHNQTSASGEGLTECMDIDGLSIGRSNHAGVQGQVLVEDQNTKHSDRYAGSQLPSPLSADDDRRLQEDHSQFPIMGFLKDMLFCAPPESDPFGTMQPSLQQTDGSAQNVWDRCMTMDDDINLHEHLSFDPFEIEAIYAQPLPYSTSDREPQTERRVSASGALAFQRSMWTYVPGPQDFGTAEQPSLALPKDTRIISESCPDTIKSVIKIKPTDRDKVLSTLLPYCEQSNVVGIISAFPSPALMESFMRVALAHRPESYISFVHAPTFQPSSIRPELLLAVVACGASLSTVTAVRKFGGAIPDLLINAIKDNWHVNNANTRDVSLLQAWALSLQIWFWSGSKRKMEIAEAVAQPAVTTLRKGGLLQRSAYDPIVPHAGDSGAALEQKWHSWVCQETKIRVTHHFFMHEMHVSIIQLTNPLISPTEMQLPLPASEELWNAGSATEWKNKFLDQVSPRKALDSVAKILRQQTISGAASMSRPSLLSSLLPLSGLWSAILVYRQDYELLKGDDLSFDTSSFGLQTRYEQHLNTLDSFRSLAASILDREGDPDKLAQTSLLIIIELYALALTAPLSNLASFAGRFGEDEARRTYPLLQEWVQSKTGRLGLWRAGQLLQLVRSLPLEVRRRNFHAFSVYQSSLLLWAYGITVAALRKKQGFNSNYQQISPKQFVLLDGEPSAQVNRFIALNEGDPAIYQSPQQITSNDCSIENYAPVHNPVATMAAAVAILAPETAGVASAPMPPFVENLTNLMSALGSAAQAVL